jgi:hypothetical protein
MSDWQRTCLFLNVTSDYLPRIMQVPSGASTVLRSDVRWHPNVLPHQESWEDDSWRADEDSDQEDAYCGLVVSRLPIRDVTLEETLESMASTRRAEDDVVRAIRLVKSADPAPFVSWDQSTDPSDAGIGRTIRCDMEKAWPFLVPEHRPACVLGKKDLDQVQGVLDDLARLDVAGAGEDIRRLRRAIGRFDLAWNRDRGDDQIIDLAIALEAMFLSREEGKGRVIARRVCFCLEAKYPSDGTLVNDVEGWYDVRSRIVHGENVDSAMNPTVRGMREIVRRCIREALKDPDSLATIRSI